VLPSSVRLQLSPVAGLLLHVGCGGDNQSQQQQRETGRVYLQVIQASQSIMMQVPAALAAA
jgi:hypothetical protein